VITVGFPSFVEDYGGGGGKGNAETERGGAVCDTTKKRRGAPCSLEYASNDRRDASRREKSARGQTRNRPAQTIRKKNLFLSVVETDPLHNGLFADFPKPGLKTPWVGEGR